MNLGFVVLELAVGSSEKDTYIQFNILSRLDGQLRFK